MRGYEILVCPICGDQIHEDYEYGARCHHAEYGEVEAVAVKVEPKNLENVMALGRLRLQTQREDVAWREAERRVFLALPKEERERIKAERLAAMNPIHSMIEATIREEIDRINRWSGLWRNYEGTAPNGS